MIADFGSLVEFPLKTIHVFGDHAPFFAKLIKIGQAVAHKPLLRLT